jgi:hypothetical protein
MMGKYDPLRDHLAARTGGAYEVRMTFHEVEALVGRLPDSARAYKVWGAHDSKVEAQAWRAAGWHVESVNLTAERVVFARGTEGETYAARLAAEKGTAAEPVQAAPAQNAAIPIDVGVSEATVQGLLVTHLAAEGWQIQRVANTATKEQGIDILAIRGGQTLAVEVKGYPGTRYADPRRAHELKPTSPATQARHWYAQAVLKSMLTHGEHPDYSIAIAFPDASTYRSLYQRTRASLNRLDIAILFVTTDGRIIEP